jgi:RNA polymerase sigma factor (sigma-70 family)
MAKATQQEIELQRRLLRKEETAFSEVCKKYLDPLVDHFTRIYSQDKKCSSELIHDAVTDALIDLIENPSRFKPELLTLEGYLRMSAEGDLRNMLTKEKRRLKIVRTGSSESVELEAKARNMIDEGAENPEQRIVDEEIDACLEELFANKKDLKIAKLIFSNVRKTSIFAEILGIGHLPESDQKKQVKREKDRIKATLKRSRSKKLLELLG